MNRRIPKVATASLVLGGAACGSDDGIEDAIRTSCKLMEECAPDYFQSEYDSVADCVSYQTSLIEYYIDYYTEEYGKACGDALRDYYECIAANTPSKRSCEDLEDYSWYYELEEACEEEYIRVERRCD